ncbi:MAG: FtsX-like permease family protein [Tissierellia bacterium]|nr:FtsX-like permease family protein [Tissierellia bacterium]
MNISGISLKYIRQHKIRTILSIISIIISVAMLTMLGSMIMGFRDLVLFDYKSMYGYNEANLIDIDYDIYKKLNSNIDIDNIVLSKKEGAINSLIYKDGQREFYPYEEDSKTEYRIRSIGEGAENIYPDLLKEGRFPKGPDEVIVSEEVFRMVPKPEINSDMQMQIAMQSEEGIEISDYKNYKIVGIMDEDKTLVMEDQIMTGLDKEDRSGLFEAYIFTGDKIAVDMNIKTICAKLGIDPEKIVVNPVYMSDDSLKLINLIIVFAGSIFILIIGASTFGGIYTVFNISYAQRQRQYGLMRAIGATEKQIKDINKREILILSALGIPLGIIIGYFLLSIMFSSQNKDVFDMLGFNDFKFKLYPQLMIFISIISLATIYLSVYSASFSKSNLSPVETIRRSDFDGVRVKNKKYPFTKLFFGMEGYIARRNIDRTRGKFFLSSVSIAVTITIFVSSVYATDMFKKNLENYRDVPDYIISYNRKTDDIMDQAFKAKLMNIKGVKEISGYYYFPVSVDANIEGEPDILTKRLANERVEGDLYTIFGSRLYIMTKEDIKKKFIVDDEELNRVIEDGSAFLYIEEYNNLWDIDFISGQEIGIGLSSEDYFRIPIKDYKIKYSNPKMEYPPGITILMPAEVASNYISNDFLVNILYYMDLNLYEGEDNKEIDDFLDTRRDLNISRNIDEKYKRDNQLKTMKNYLYGFSALMALVSAINIINSIGSNMITRKKELSLLKAIGMNRSSFKNMMRMEAVYYSILGSILGFIFSFVTTRILNEAFNIINYEMTNSGIYKYPFGSYLLIVIVTIIIVYLSCIIAMKRVVGSDLIGNLRNE